MRVGFSVAGLVFRVFFSSFLWDIPAGAAVQHASIPCPLKIQGHVAVEQTKRDLIPALGGGSLNKAPTVPDLALPQQGASPD